MKCFRIELELKFPYKAKSVAHYDLTKGYICPRGFPESQISEIPGEFGEFPGFKSRFDFTCKTINSLLKTSRQCFTDHGLETVDFNGLLGVIEKRLF